MPRARTVPGWVISEGEDEDLGVLRAGKEAGCFLVRRSAGDRFCLLVRKDYRKRSDRTYSAPVRAGERGLRRDLYEGAMAIVDAREGAGIDQRSRRAVRKRTEHGWKVLEGVMAGREFATLERLWSAGARVPYPVEQIEHGFLMQYVGTVGACAPRLADVRLERTEAGLLFDRVIDELRVFARAGIVHGDLSAYNILLQHGCPWIIELPQAVDLYTYPAGRELFARDVVNICRYFERQGVWRDPEQLTTELLSRD